MLQKRSYSPLTHSDIRGIIHTFYQVFPKNTNSCAPQLLYQKGWIVLKSKQNYFIKKTEKILGDLESCRNSLAYLTSVRNNANLPPYKAEVCRRRIQSLTKTLDAAEHALALLDPVERTVIEGMCICRTPEALEDVCEACGLERSSVYRYRTRALKKLAVALFGEVV